MLLVLCHHLNAIVLVENNHLQGVGCHQLEGDEVPDLDLVSNKEEGQPLSRMSMFVHRPDLALPNVAGVRPQHEFRWDDGQVLDEVEG